MVRADRAAVAGRSARRRRIGRIGLHEIAVDFDVRHVAEAVLYIANLPLEANVQFMTVMATKMPFVGRG